MSCPSHSVVTIPNSAARESPTVPSLCASKPHHPRGVLNGLTLCVQVAQRPRGRSQRLVEGQDGILSGVVWLCGYSLFVFIIVIVEL